jgi:hypothetical protein
MPALDERRRGTVLEALGSHDHAVALGCFSKACSVFGPFVAGGKGLRRLGLAALGGVSPIVTVLFGDEADTFCARRFLFDRGSPSQFPRSRITRGTCGFKST